MYLHKLLYKNQEDWSKHKVTQAAKKRKKAINDSDWQYQRQLQQSPAGIGIGCYDKNHMMKHSCDFEFLNEIT